MLMNSEKLKARHWLLPCTRFRRKMWVLILYYPCFEPLDFLLFFLVLLIYLLLFFLGGGALISDEIQTSFILITLLLVELRISAWYSIQKAMKNEEIEKGADMRVMKYPKAKKYRQKIPFKFK